MIGVILLVLAVLCFLGAALNQTFFGEHPADLVAWGLAFGFAALLLAQPVIATRLGRGE